ncbi:MAG: hypothetical protein WEB00_10810 [Dehalococcoidia bacterium]
MSRWTSKGATVRQGRSLAAGEAVDFPAAGDELDDGTADALRSVARLTLLADLSDLIAVEILSAGYTAPPLDASAQPSSELVDEFYDLSEQIAASEDEVGNALELLGESAAGISLPSVSLGPTAGTPFQQIDQELVGFWDFHKSRTEEAREAVGDPPDPSAAHTEAIASLAAGEKVKVAAADELSAFLPGFEEVQASRDERLARLRAQAANIYGLSPEELLRMSPDELRQDIRDRVRAAVEACCPRDFTPEDVERAAAVVANTLILSGAGRGQTQGTEDADTAEEPADAAAVQLTALFTYTGPTGDPCTLLFIPQQGTVDLSVDFETGIASGVLVYSDRIDVPVSCTLLDSTGSDELAYVLDASATGELSGVADAETGEIVLTGSVTLSVECVSGECDVDDFSFPLPLEMTGTVDPSSGEGAGTIAVDASALAGEEEEGLDLTWSWESQ